MNVFEIKAHGHDARLDGRRSTKPVYCGFDSHRVHPLIIAGIAQGIKALFSENRYSGSSPDPGTSVVDTEVDEVGGCEPPVNRCKSGRSPHLE